VSDDKLTYTFTLKKGIKFHDGHPVTVEDIKFAYDIIMDPTVNAAHLRNYYQDIKSAEVLDSHTIRFTYARPYFMAKEFCGGIPAIPKHIFENGDFNDHPNGRHPVGTGPFKFVEWKTGEKIILERNPEYWGTVPQIKRMVFKLITDNAAALIVLKKKNLDLMGLTSLQWVKQTDKDSFAQNFRKEQYYQPNYNYIGWNSLKVYFSDKRVRRALTHLVNREEILATLYFGLGKIVTGTAYINTDYYDRGISPIGYDPKAARVLLDEAGWIDSDGDGIRDKNGVPFKFTFTFSTGSETAEQIATLLKEEFAKSGIEMTIKKLEWATFIAQVQSREYDAVTLGWSLGIEMDPYQLWHSSQATEGSNFTGFVNAEADQIIENVRITFEKEDRIPMLKRFHRILHEEQPYTFLFCKPSLVSISKRFGNVEIYPLGLRPREWTILENPAP